MSDSEMLDWLERRYTTFCETGTEDEQFTLRLIGDKRDHEVRGASLRDCIQHAAELPGCD